MSLIILSESVPVLVPLGAGTGGATVVVGLTLGTVVVVVVVEPLIISSTLGSAGKVVSVDESPSALGALRCLPV
jgi:hypothetical protein